MRACSIRSWLRAPGTSSGSNWRTAEAVDHGQHAVRACGQRARRGEQVVLERGTSARQLAGSIGGLGTAGRTVSLAYTRCKQMATQRDYYDILGVPRGAPDEDIKRSFRKLAQQWHPDVNTSRRRDERFKEINEAYQVLSDPQRRQAYDMFGRGRAVGAGGFDPFGGFNTGQAASRALATSSMRSSAAPRPAAAGRACPTGADLRYDLHDDLRRVDHRRREGDRVHCAGQLRDVQRQRRGAGHGAHDVPQVQGHGRDLRSVRSTMLGQIVNVTPCDRCKGTGKIVETPCHTCQGDGRVERKRKLRVTIPAGIDDRPPDPPIGRRRGARRAAACRATCTWSSTCTPHPQLRRRDTELFYDLSLSITQAALGARVTVPTADGEEEIEIKAGTQPGARSGCAARACRICAGPGVARRPARDGRCARSDSAVGAPARAARRAVVELAT